MKIFNVLSDASKTVKKTDFPKITQFFLFFDVVYCRLRFHAVGKEYLMYRFYEHKNRYRKDFLTAYDMEYGIRRINEKGFTGSKYNLSLRLSEFYGREVILAPACTEELFVAFARKHKRIVLKPDKGSCGRGVTEFNYIDDDQAREFFSEIRGRVACEEYIVQHEIMDKINPYSVNTVRIVSLLDGDKVIFACSTFRTGTSSEKITDNLSRGGIGAQVDVETGIVTTTGFDYKGNRYVNHPVSGVQFIGFRIPNWDKVAQLVTKAHRKCPTCKLLGWDIAVTADGAVIVEANNAPDAPHTQLGDLVPKGKDAHRIMKTGKKYRPPKKKK